MRECQSEPLNPSRPSGGGAALLHLSELIPAFRLTLELDEERLGADIVMKSLRAPCRIIAHNAGVEGEVGAHTPRGSPGHPSCIYPPEPTLALEPPPTHPPAPLIHPAYHTHTHARLL